MPGGFSKVAHIELIKKKTENRNEMPNHINQSSNQYYQSIKEILYNYKSRANWRRVMVMTVCYLY